MKTIEERAEEYARNKFRDVLLISERDYLELVRDFSADYAKMATEQRAIDIKEACDLAWKYLLVSTPLQVAEARLLKFHKALTDSDRTK